MPIPSKTLKEIVREMPEKIRDLYTGTSEVTVVDICDGLGKKYNLNNSQINLLINIVGNILLGRLPFNSFRDEVLKLGGDLDSLDLLIKEAYEIFFSEVADDLKDRERTFSKYSVPTKIEPEKSVPPPTPPSPKPIVETRPTEPFIKTETARREPESVHTLDRETLLRELESPEPFNVPFVQRQTTFEEKILHAETLPKSIPVPTQTTPAPETGTPPSPHDPYREKPAL